MVLLVTRKNGKARCLTKRKLVKSVCVTRVVQLRKHDLATVSTSISPRIPTKGFIFAPNINRVSPFFFFRALSINRYHEPRRDVTRLSLPVPAFFFFFPPRFYNSFADTFIFRISGPYLSINIRFSKQQRADSPVRHPRGALFLFATSARKTTKGLTVFTSRGTRRGCDTFATRRWRNQVPMIDPLFALFASHENPISTVSRETLHAREKFSLNGTIYLSRRAFSRRWMALSSEYRCFNYARI